MEVAVEAGAQKEQPGSELRVEEPELCTATNRYAVALSEAGGVASGVQDRASNTEEGWKEQVEEVLRCEQGLEEQVARLNAQQEQEEEQHKRLMQQLEKRRCEGVSQHQALLDKLESVRVKLQLNNSKASRKNFLSRKQDLMSEKSRAEEERSRLSREQEESERRLASLQEEQVQEQQLWEQELQDLRQQLEEQQREAQEAELTALQEELAAAEKQRAVQAWLTDSWLHQVGQYLGVLRLERSQRAEQQQQHWEQQEAEVRRSQEDLMEARGLAREAPPALPTVPMVELIITQMMCSLDHVASTPPPTPPIVTPPPAPVTYRPPPQFRPAPSHSPSPPVRLHASPLLAAPPGGPGDKLDKLLERLGSRFPQCTRAQLMVTLQQIKTSRGTMAGLSMDQVLEQVGLLLAQGEHAGHMHRPVHVARLCLMCQNHVELSRQYPLPCAHTVHRDCLRVWLQAGQSNSCPFCPAR